MGSENIASFSIRGSLARNEDGSCAISPNNVFQKFGAVPKSVLTFPMPRTSWLFGISFYFNAMDKQWRDIIISFSSSFICIPNFLKLSNHDLTRLTKMQLPRD
jgi:hypothetical protein